MTSYEKIVLFLPKEIIKKLNKIAFEKNIPTSKIIGELIEKYIKSKS